MIKRRRKVIDMKKILTFGVFDFFHLGHLRLFKQCKEYADWKSWGEQAKEVFGPESYHGSDFSFFYYNIRENAVLRAKKWFEKYK